MPAAAGLLDSAFHFVGLALQNAHLSLGQAHLALQRLHVPEGTFFVETLLAFALQKHFRGFQGDEIHTLHTRRGAELAGLLAQFGHVQGWTDMKLRKKRMTPPAPATEKRTQSTHKKYFFCAIRSK